MDRWSLALVLVALVGGCAWISDPEEAARLDLDLDLLPRPRDCDDDDPKIGKESTWYPDNDDDGFGTGAGSVTGCIGPPGFVLEKGDCDDEDATTYPDAAEVCNGLDNDCNGLLDDGLEHWWVYADRDGDLFGDPEKSLEVCADLPGYIREAGDCDDGPDTGPSVNPSALEVCNGIDDNCDGLVDDDDPTLESEDSTWYLDADGDGFGDDDTVDTTCTPTSGQVADSSDCNDEDAAINPSAIEVCDGEDNNCDGGIDEDTADDAPDWYDDADGDGFGDPTALPFPACHRPVGKTGVQAARDCDDDNAAIHPGAPEECDDVDNDCDILVDDADPSRVNAPFWYFDADSDTFGDPATGVQMCVAPARYVGDYGDCDDGDSAVNPLATEVCDGIDNNCNNDIDDGDDGLDPAELSNFFPDSDSDGFGEEGALPVASCAAPSNHADNDDDCDDLDPDTHPDAPEICNGVDNNCNGIQDEGVQIPWWYPDADGDGFGAGPGIESCTPLSGHSAVDGDCDDGDPERNPGEEEICDSKDNDCDGETDTDDDDLIAGRWFRDADNDGYGTVLDELISCVQPTGYVADDTDCDDSELASNFGAAEICDGIDNDCDGLVDGDDRADLIATSYYPDLDEDGFGAEGADPWVACSGLDGFAPSTDDCDDGDPTVWPGAQEVCDGIDNDCDGDTDDADSSLDLATGQLGYADVDNDGYGDPLDPAAAQTCVPGGGQVFDATDCNDNDDEIFPGAPEYCDGVDHDCDNQVYEAAGEWYLDADNDGFGDPNISQIQCIPDPGYVQAGTDCNDNDFLINPDATEICDGTDNDCDDDTDDEDNDMDGERWFADLDGDGYGDPTDSLIACDQPDDYVLDNTDCDDFQAVLHPDAPEVCDNIDNDCDGYRDEADPDIIGALPWHFDSDSDGFGDPQTETLACNQPEFHVTNDTDCDDTDPATHPGADEVCDTVDNDCNTQIDDADPGLLDPLDWYVDSDLDGYGAGPVAAGSCSQPPGLSSVDTDCDDTDGLVYPGADIGGADVGDGLDRNCDGSEECYLDADLDGDGDLAWIVFDGGDDLLCVSPGESLIAGDCDDANPDVYPGSPEYCGDGIDNDCDLQDETLQDDPTPVTWWLDRDGDGFGGGIYSVVSCGQPDAFVLDDTDCDDEFTAWAASIQPGAAEVCDLIDNDCDGSVDNDDGDLIGGPCLALPAVDEAFTCSDIADIGTMPEIYGWQSTWNADNWTTDTTSGVANQVTSGLDLLGAGNDAENFLLTGHSSWFDTTIEATITADSGNPGLILRYAGPQSYYSCAATDGLSPGCFNAPVAGDRVVLSRVDGMRCTNDDDYTIGEVPFSYSPGISYNMRLSILRSQVVCDVDVDGNGNYGDPGDVQIAYLDASPLPPGLTGVSAWNLTNGVFDDLLVTVADGDADYDGLPNDTEPALFLDALDPDSDRDTIADVHETPMAGSPPDPDSDGEINALDRDSDNDGLSDEVEAGDVDLYTPPVDTDCDGIPDYMDLDSDGDGFDDELDNCRLLPNDQTDADADDLGLACDPDDNNPDIDGDFLIDGLEVAGGSDPTVQDTDGDGLWDGDEYDEGTDRLFSDSDADGLSDGDEVNLWNTEPLDADTDGGCAKDGEEVDAGTDPLDGSDDEC